MGDYHDLYGANFDNFAEMQDKLFAFARSSDEQKLIIAANFSADEEKSLDLIIPESLVGQWQLEDGHYQVVDDLNHHNYTLNVESGVGRIAINFTPLATLFLRLTTVN